MADVPHEKIILCIDDDQDTCELVKAILGLDLYQVETVTTAAEGLEKARYNRYQLILLDLQLLNGDGIELCRQIRLFDPKTPILFYSGEGRQSHIQASLDAGAQDYLLKPVAPEDLRRKVNAYLRKDDGLAAP